MWLKAFSRGAERNYYRYKYSILVLLKGVLKIWCDG